MSEARAKAEARKKKILVSTDSTKQSLGEKNKTESSPVNNTKLQGDEDPTVICTDVENEIECKSRTGDNRLSTNGQDADAVLDDLLDKIDISSVLSEDALKSNKKSATRVVLAAKDYNPMEREKSLAKRKAMEQEIVRQTAEFDRLAQLAKDQRVAESKGEKSVHDSCSNKLKGAGTSDAKSNKVRKTLRLNLSQNDWTKIARCLVLVVIGSYVGLTSTNDTNRLFASYPSAMNKYMRSLSYGIHDMKPADILQDHFNLQNEDNNYIEIVRTLLPTIWREECSNLFVLLNYPIVVVVLVRLLFLVFGPRLIAVDSLVGDDRAKGGVLASAISLISGDFSVVTSPLADLLGEVCIYIFALVFTAVYFQLSSFADFQESSEFDEL